MVDLNVPDFDISAFYYADILQVLRELRRTNLPEFDSDNEYDPLVQLERAFALVGHRDMVLLDAAAREAILPTAVLLQSVRAMFRLISYFPRDAVPAVTDILAPLTKLFTTTPSNIIPALTLFATQGSQELSPITFEVIEGIINSPRTDLLTKCFADESTVFTDYTTEANTGSSFFSPWTTPAIGDALYIAHSHVIWSEIDVIMNSFASGITGVWEYYDGEWQDVNPDDDPILDVDKLKFEINDLLGTIDRASATVRITLLSTGAFEDVQSTFSGGINRVESTGLLGQSSPSLNRRDYSVGVLWHPLDADGSGDGTSNFTTDGKIEYELPQTLEKNWTKGIVNGVESYWIRYRIISVSTPTGPSIDRLKINTGNQFGVVRATQGQTQDDDPLGDSDGTPNQIFPLTTPPVLEGTISVEVDEGSGFEEWILVDSFADSRPFDKHFKLELDDDDIPRVIFGDGVNGKIPASGTDNIKARYRFGGEDNGNVSANTITINRSGVAFLGAITNPRPAFGWAPEEGGDEAGLTRLKEAGPASVRTIGGATLLSDAESVVTRFINSVGASPVARATGFEEAFGLKTIEVVVVGAGGNLLTEADRAGIELYLNGDPTVKLRGKGLANHRFFISNYSQKIIDVEAEVEGGTKIEIENILRALLDPLALKSDGVSYVWNFDDEIPTSRIIAEIFEVSGVRKVDLIQPSTDIQLGARELPIIGTLAITVTP